MLRRIQRKKYEFVQAAYAPPERGTVPQHYVVVSKMVGRNSEVLDLGCFTGTASLMFLKNSNIVTGIDLSRRAIRVTKRKGISVVLADADEHFPFRDDCFDIVFAGELIEHVLDVDFWLSEIRRVLRPQGYCVLTTPNLASLGRRILLLLGKDPLTNISCFSGAGHLRYFVKETLTQLLERNNFRVVEIRSDIVNFSSSGRMHSTKLAQWFSTLGRGLIVKAQTL